MIRVALLLAAFTISGFILAGCARPSPNGPAPSLSHDTPVVPVAAASQSTATAGDQSAPTGEAPAITRPALASQTGQYFTWQMPADWKSSETANAVDLISPDGKTIVNSAL